MGLKVLSGRGTLSLGQSPPVPTSPLVSTLGLPMCTWNRSEPQGALRFMLPGFSGTLWLGAPSRRLVWNMDCFTGLCAISFAGLHKMGCQKGPGILILDVSLKSYTG